MEWGVKEDRRGLLEKQAGVEGGGNILLEGRLGEVSLMARQVDSCQDKLRSNTNSTA